jgi:hypothetical protein
VPVSSRDIMQAAQGILQAAFDGMAWPTDLSLGVPHVQLGAPVNPAVKSEWCFIIRAGNIDAEKTTHGWVRRTHLLRIKLMLMVATDEETIELLFADLCETLEGAFYTNRKLSNTAATSALKQHDARGGGGSTPYEHVGEELYFRTCVYHLEVEEDQTYQMR